jgi:prolipoprotein diacylglyceryltransferase
VLYLLWRRSRRIQDAGSTRALFSQPGCTFGLMLILYAIVRFLIEFVRDDNPFELAGLTISQLLNLGLMALGIVLIMVFQRAKFKGPAARPQR